MQFLDTKLKNSFNNFEHHDYEINEDKSTPQIIITEIPFEVNKALISRSMVFQLHPLDTEDVVKVLKKSLNDERGLKEYKIKIEDEIPLRVAHRKNGF